jgi:hypothetical protein
MFNFGKKDKPEVSGSADQRKGAAMSTGQAAFGQKDVESQEIQDAILNVKIDGDSGSQKASESK